MRFIEGNSNVSSKKIDMLRDFAAVVYLPEAQNLVRVYGILMHKGKVEGGWGELNLREGERGNSSQSWVEKKNKKT